MRITKRQQKQIDNIGRKYKLDMVVLHGSQATGKIISSEPDIDIAVFRCGGISFDEQIKLTGEFMNVFGNNVDVKTLHKKDALFRFEVMRDSQLLYGEKAFYNDFYLYAYKDYNDKKDLFANTAVIQRARQKLLNKLYA
jgi:predicted nucleotidyltransferase